MTTIASPHQTKKTAGKHFQPEMTLSVIWFASNSEISLAAGQRQDTRQETAVVVGNCQGGRLHSRTFEGPWPELDPATAAAGVWFCSLFCVFWPWPLVGNSVIYRQILLYNSCRTEPANFDRVCLQRRQQEYRFIDEPTGNMANAIGKGRV